MKSKVLSLGQEVIWVAFGALFFAMLIVLGSNAQALLL